MYVAAVVPSSTNLAGWEAGMGRVQDSRCPQWLVRPAPFVLGRDSHTPPLSLDGVARQLDSVAC